jgi:outer membrane protein assembly factor BamB
MYRRSGSLLSATVFSCSICLAPFSGHGYTSVQVGVYSNFLIDQGRVLFVQADGSLTVLRLETGEVLLREKSRDYSGRLLRVPDGILVLNYGTITLLNPANFAALWDTTVHYDPHVTDDVLVSYDGNGSVQCRHLRDGTVRWTYQLPGALEVIEQAGRVLIHRSATYEEKVVPTTVLLELQTGKEVFRKTPPAGVHWENVFFDGTNVYVMTGPFKNKRSDFEPERLTVWNARGEEIHSIAVPADLRNRPGFGSGPFDLEQKTFWKGRVYPDRQSIPGDTRGKLIATDEKTNNGVRISETIYGLADDVSVLLRDMYPASGSRRDSGARWEIEVRTPNTQWTGILPYLASEMDIYAVCAANGKVLIGSRYGHVECISAATGQSQWLYVFPTLRHTMSYSSHGMPPMASQAAAVFRREDGKRPNSGLQVKGRDMAAAHIIFDPAPINPFQRLPFYLLIAWTGALLPFASLIAWRLNKPMRSWSSKNPGAIPAAMAVLSTAVLFVFGRVSPGSSIALRLALLACLVFGFADAIRSYRNGQRPLAVVLIVLFGMISFFTLPVLLS